MTARILRAVDFLQLKTAYLYTKLKNLPSHGEFLMLFLKQPAGLANIWGPGKESKAHFALQSPSFQVKGNTRDSV